MRKWYGTVRMTLNNDMTAEELCQLFTEIIKEIISWEIKPDWSTIQLYVKENFPPTIPGWTIAVKVQEEYGGNDNGKADGNNTGDV